MRTHMISKDAFTDLIEAQFRGQMARAFLRTGIEPEEQYLRMIRGEAEVTMRALGEVGHITGLELDIDITKPRTSRSAPAQSTDT